MQTERALPVGTTLTAIGELARVSEGVGAYPGAVQQGDKVGAASGVAARPCCQWLPQMQYPSSSMMIITARFEDSSIVP